MYFLQLILVKSNKCIKFLLSNLIISASKSEYFVDRDFLKKVVIGGIVSYHLLPDDFQLDTNKIRHGKITSGFFQTIALLT